MHRASDPAGGARRHASTADREWFLGPLKHPLKARSSAQYQKLLERANVLVYLTGVLGIRSVGLRIWRMDMPKRREQQRRAPRAQAPAEKTAPFACRLHPHTK